MEIDDNEKEDFFEETEVPEKVEETRKPVYKPDDPRYWEEPEDEFEHLRPSGRVNWKLWAVVLICGIVSGLLWFAWLRCMHPYVQEATQSGYIEKIEKQGEVFMTFEGTLLPYKNLMDTTRAYDSDFEFSATDPSVAAEMVRMQTANLPVRVHYRRYHVGMPWRGATKVLVTSVDSVNPADILPPDRQPSVIIEKVDDKKSER